MDLGILGKPSEKNMRSVGVENLTTEGRGPNVVYLNAIATLDRQPWLCIIDFCNDEWGII